MCIFFSFLFFSAESLPLERLEVQRAQLRPLPVSGVERHLRLALHALLGVGHPRGGHLQGGQLLARLALRLGAHSAPLQAVAEMVIFWAIFFALKALLKLIPSRVPPRFGDDDDEEEDSSSDDHLRSRHSSRRGNSGGGGGGHGSGNGGAGGGSARQMTKMGGKSSGKGGKKKSRQLLDANLPTHCESQIALKNNEERDDDDEEDDDDSEDSSGQIGVYMDGSASSHYVAPGFRSTNQASSAASSAINSGGVTNGALQVNHSRTTSYESDSGLKMFPTPTTNSSSSSNSTNSTSKKGGSGGGKWVADEPVIAANAYHHWLGDKHTHTHSHFTQQQQLHLITVTFILIWKEDHHRLIGGRSKLQSFSVYNYHHHQHQHHLLLLLHSFPPSTVPFHAVSWSLVNLSRSRLFFFFFFFSSTLPSVIVWYKKSCTQTILFSFLHFSVQKTLFPYTPANSTLSNFLFTYYIDQGNMLLIW